MRSFLKKRNTLVLLTMVISMLIGIIPAQAASVWSFTAGSGKKISVNDTVIFEKNEYQDINLYKEGKEIKKNDKNYEVTWSSSNPDVVWVDKSNGKMRADKFKKMSADTATAKITATIRNKKTRDVAKKSFSIKVLGDNGASVSNQSPTNTPSPAAHVIYEGTTVEISKARVGDVVLFGTYEQDNIESNGAEAIPWYVLDKDGEQLLLMSVYLLDCVPYHESYSSITWENCTLRQWMNDEFYNGAFTESEKKYIQASYLKNEDNPYYGTEGGNDTEDKVFALSLAEAEQYFGIAEYFNTYVISASPEISAAKVTAYAEAQGVYVSTWISTAGNGYWWLRSLGSNYWEENKVFVTDSGYIDAYGDFNYYGESPISFNDVAARPALWLNLNSGSENTTPSLTPTVTKIYGTLDLTSAGWSSYSVGVNANFTGGTHGKIYPGAKLEILEECTNTKGTLVYKVYSDDLKKECYVTAKYVKVDSSVVPPQTEPVVTPIVIPEVNKTYGTLDLTSAGWSSYSVGINANFTGGTHGKIYQGAKLEILEECTNAKGTLVYRVYSFDLEKECYVTAKYVKISTDTSVGNVEQTTGGVYGATINMFNTLLNSLNETKEVFSQSNYWIYDDYHKIHLPNLITDTGLIQQKFESIYNQTFDEKDISYSLYSMRLLRETLEKDIYLLKEYRDSLSVKLLGGDTLKKSIDEVVSWFEWNSQDQINQLIEAIKKEAKEARRVKIVEVAYQEFENNKTNPFSKRQDVKYNYNRPSADDGSKPAAWCASFVNWCAYAAGIPESIIPHETQESAYISKNGKDYSLAYVPHLVEYMQKYCGAVIYTIDSEAMTSGTYVPRAGDLIIYMSGSGGMRHIGLVVDFDEVSKRVITIEGNTTDTETKATGYIETKNRAYMNQNVAPSQDFYLLGYLAPNY